MPLELTPLQIVAWLVTYLVHSTLLLTLAWLLTRRRLVASLASRERLWKLAVTGGFLTASLQIGLGLEPPLGRIALRADSPALTSAAGAGREPALADGSEPIADEHDAEQPARTGPPARSAAGAQPALTREGRSSGRDARAPLQPAPADPVPFPAVAAAGADPRAPGLPAMLAWPLRAGLTFTGFALQQAPTRVADRVEPDPSPVALESAAVRSPVRLASVREIRELDAVVPSSWSRGALAGWGLAGVACALLFALGLRRLRRDLVGRIELTEGPVVAQVERLRLRAGVPRKVRIELAPRLAAPLSMGWVRPVLCLPPRVLEELEPEELAAMLAHEVAHLARRDPLWLFVLWLVQTAFFFQPLNRLARRELAAGFELAADAWAARATGERLALASCLARIAGWIVGAPPPRAHRAWGAAMADALDARRPRSRLGERIERLLDPDALDEPQAPRRLEASLGFALLAGLALLAPGAAASVEEAGAPALAAPVDPASPESRTPTAARPAEPASPFAGLDAEMGGLASELTALREELQATGLGVRYVEVLAELELRVERLAARRDRIEVLLERARALEAGATAAPPPWQDESLPSQKD